MRIALISCVKTKQPVPAPAGQLYTSPLFRALRTYARHSADSWYILSAEHGVLEPNEITAPYERTLNRMSKEDRVAGAERVGEQLLDRLPAGAEIIMLAGKNYRDQLVPMLRARGFSVTIPLEGMPLGRQLQHLNTLAKHDGREP